MNNKIKIDQFNNRWGIHDGSTLQTGFNSFRNRILNIFKNIDTLVSDSGMNEFCNILGIENGPFTSIRTALSNTTNQKTLYFYIQIIFYLEIVGTISKVGLHAIWIKKLEEAIDYSNSNLAITQNKDEVILFPKGEKQLDNKLVIEILSFLNQESQNHFISALKSYEKNNPTDSIKSAESLRRTLEEFLRFKLKNTKGLDANIKELQSQLKQSGREATVRNIIFQVFSYLDQYFNENSKHNDGDINETENEFLIYQTGVLMRYIHKSIP